MIIYKITNTLDNKIYIGQTIRTLKARWNSHCCKSSTTTHIARAIKKYGKENFTIEEIDRAETLDELNTKEIYWIEFYNSMDQEIGYNLRSGGENYTTSDITKERMSKAAKGKKKKPLSEEHKAAISKFFKGRKCPNRKKRGGYTRTPATQETRDKMRNSQTGKKHSPETIEKMREVKKGKVRTEEHKENLRKVNLGKKASPEAKENMRRARNAYLERKKCLEENTGTTQEITEIKLQNLEEKSKN